jgi:hypothetical protein
MPPRIYPDLSWSGPGRFRRLLRTLQIVAIAASVGAVGGATAVLGIVGITGGFARQQSRAPIADLRAPVPVPALPNTQAQPAAHLQSAAVEHPQAAPVVSPQAAPDVQSQPALAAPAPPSRIETAPSLPAWPILAGARAHTARVRSAMTHLYDRAEPLPDTATPLPPVRGEAATMRAAKRSRAKPVARFAASRPPLSILPSQGAALSASQNGGWSSTSLGDRQNSINPRSRGFFASDDWRGRGNAGSGLFGNNWGN